MNHESVLRARALMPAIWLAFLSSCQSTPTLLHPERFYLQAPAKTTFEYERTIPESSWIRGTLTLDVTKVELADAIDDTYRMTGTLSMTTRGMFDSREAARQAPRRFVQAAMEPDNVGEVFETVSSQPGVTITRIHWGRLRTLRLPIEYEDGVPASPFNSSLRGGALDNAAEVALVWHKVISPFFSIAPFGQFTATDIDEREGNLELTLVQRLSPGNALRFRYRFARGAGLRGIEVKLADGSVLRIRALE